MKDRVEEKGKWMYSVHQKELAIIRFCACHSCKKWIHKRCSGLKGSLLKARQSFIFRYWNLGRPIADGINTDLDLDIGNGVSLEMLDKFCYL